MKFDTRNKKPKLYDLLPLTAVVVALILLFGRDVPANQRLICWVLGAYYAAVILRLAVAFRGQLQYNPYSYNTILYSGFALFLLSVLITHSVLSFRMLRYPEVYTRNELPHLVLGSAKNYILLSSPFLLLFSAALCVALSEGRNAVEAIRFANIAAGLAVTKYGVIESIPSRMEIENYIRGKDGR